LITASSGFTWGSAIVIFVIVIVAFSVIIAVVFRRTQRLSYRPVVRDRRDQQVRRAAEEDIETIEDDPSFINRHDVPGGREDDL
jgi:archaellum component FlaG (FlaF/FlaG flagellin family)